uniref:Uncharacterized protein LOC111118901 n=1 Tax=Crassostrea virginica TaxID=6565 RepID=A0A8B8CGK8_CRAVI|nr:uncharacterized protein LOC111118901 [Crassostrea virginica]
METICDYCKDFHKFVPNLQNHKIVTIADSGEWRNGVEVEEFCAENDGKVIDAFCYNHDNLCCSICLVKHHRTCLNVESLEDIAAEKEENDVATILSSLIKMEKSLENMQLNNQAKLTHLNSKKDAICIDTEKKIEEVKKKLDDAHEQWVKQFEQTHVDSVGNIEIVSDELKRFSTSVHETRIILQSMISNGSPKQLFITKHKQLAQMADHMSRMKSLDIWDLAEDYSQLNLDFLSQIVNENKFNDVDLTKLPSGMIETILQMAPVVMANEYIMRRRRQMSKKDWMKVEFLKTSEISLPYDVYYGLFVDDTKIVLPFSDPSSLKIFDVSTATGTCIHTENCQKTPYDLCHARGALNLHEVDRLEKGNLRGLTFDRHDNVLVCIGDNKLKQVRHGGKESRDIELAGIGSTYNVVLHPTGEKMLVMDYKGGEEKCCVYQIL